MQKNKIVEVNTYIVPTFCTRILSVIVFAIVYTTLFKVYNA